MIYLSIYTHYIQTYTQIDPHTRTHSVIVMRKSLLGVRVGEMIVGFHDVTIISSSVGECGGGKILCPFFHPSPKIFWCLRHLPQAAVSPLLCVKKKMIILSFFLTRATPRRRALWQGCGVGRADRRPPSGRDRGRACAEVERESRQAVCDTKHVGALRTSMG